MFVRGWQFGQAIDPRTLIRGLIEASATLEPGYPSSFDPRTLIRGLIEATVVEDDHVDHDDDPRTLIRGLIEARRTALPAGRSRPAIRGL